MSEIDESRAEIEAQARAWLVRLRSGDATTQDAEAFRQWCAENPEHARMARVMHKTWKVLNTAASEVSGERLAEAGTSKARWLVQSGGSSGFRPGRRAFVGAAVAAGATWLAIKPPLQLWPALGDFAADYRTGTGEQRRVVLAGRVVVEMNTQTRLDVLPAQAVQGRQNGIRLLAGEAEVVAGGQVGEHDASATARPFVVVAEQGRLQADVARFNVRRLGSQVCVTCVSGTVEFEHPQRRLTLLASQQLVYDAGRVQAVTHVDPAAVLSWRRGVLVFNGVPLAEVVDEINRYRPGKLVLRNAALGNRRVQAQFSIARLGEAVQMISQLYGAHVTQLPGNIALLS
jgi:transmembrane sensor